MNIEIIAQIIGFIAFGIGVASFLQKDERKLRILLGASGATLCLHFVLLGAYTGAAAVFVTSTRNVLSIYGWAKKFAPLFYLAVIGFGWYTHDDLVDIFPVLAGICGTTTVFYLSGIKMRLGFIAGSSLWVVHNVMVGSIGPTLMESMMIGASAYRIYRMNIEHKRALGNDTALTP